MNILAPSSSSLKNRSLPSAEKAHVFLCAALCGLETLDLMATVLKGSETKGCILLRLFASGVSLTGLRCARSFSLII